MFSLELVKWIQTACLNIHILTLKSEDVGWIDLHFDFDRLKNLKELHVNAQIACNLKVVTFLPIPKIEPLLTSSKIFRKCRQVEILRLDVCNMDLEDFAELEPAERTTEVHLSWGSGPSIEDVLPILRRWRHLRRLTLSRWSDRSVPPIQVPRSQCRWLQLKKSGNSAGQSERFHHG